MQRERKLHDDTGRLEDNARIPKGFGNVSGSVRKALRVLESWADISSGADHTPLQSGQFSGSIPKTATPVEVPTNTLPFTMIGVMNLLLGN